MSSTDSQELNRLLKEARSATIVTDSSAYIRVSSKEDSPSFQPTIGSCQWSSSDGKIFLPSSKTVTNLVPAVYDICHNPNFGLYFEQIPVLTTGLVRFPDSNSDKVIAEIQKFWTKEEVFRFYKLNYKRGIMLWGPPGSGKSCTIQFVMRGVIDLGGIVVRFTHPGLFVEGIRKFREIQPDTPIVVLMEDIDSTLERFSESEVLNILDGVNQVDKVVFLATTNYPEKLGGRIINRPSRFDKRFKIGHPNAECRRMYFEFVIGKEKLEEFKIDLDQWVNDTHEFSIAHMKELFTAVVILGDSYEEAIEALSLMKEEKPDSSNDESKKFMGFGSTSSFKKSR